MTRAGTVLTAKDGFINLYFEFINVKLAILTIEDTKTARRYKEVWKRME